MEQFVYKDKKKLRCGYTTGSCAAAAAKAAAIMLFIGEKIDSVDLLTPGGVSLRLNVEETERNSDSVSCAVRKDAGDDADITDGILIYATVQRQEKQGIEIDGGEGIGRVTRPGLEQSPGSAAINSVPRRMIRDALSEVCDTFGYEGGLKAVIWAPEGTELAKKTFNPNLGVEGGISILGTSGIVEPMSEKALTDTIRLELKMHRARGSEFVILIPGNYGMNYMRDHLPWNVEDAVKCSNLIGEAIDMAWELGFRKILLIGHIGKLVKLGAGIMNTHSRNADGRMEVLCACALEADVPAELSRRILHCITTDEAVGILREAGMLSQVMERLLCRIQKHLDRRAGEDVQIGAVIFSNEYGLLGMTKQAEIWRENQYGTFCRGRAGSSGSDHSARTETDTGG